MKFKGADAGVRYKRREHGAGGLLFRGRAGPGAAGDPDRGAERLGGVAAHLALALSDDPEVREFAELMISDHEAVNQAALDLLKKLKAEPQDNAFSQALLKGARDNWTKMAQLSGKEFDKSYAANELAYHQTVNKVVGEAFIPNVENAELKALLGQALDVFQAHEKHAADMVTKVGS